MGTSATATSEALRLPAWSTDRAPITPLWDFDKLLDARAISIGELAAASGVSWTTCWRVVTGIGVPSTRTRRRLAQALAVQVDMIRWPKRAALSG